MGAYKTHKIKQSLTSKGFVKDNRHHFYFWLYIDNKKSNIFTCYSHNAKECGDSILGQMAKQLELSRRQFDDLIDCRLNGEGYLEILKKKGVLRETE